MAVIVFRDLYRRWRCWRDRCSDVVVVAVPPSQYQEITYYRCTLCGRYYIATSATDFTRTRISEQRYRSALLMAAAKQQLDQLVARRHGET